MLPSSLEEGWETNKITNTVDELSMKQHVITKQANL